MRQVWLVCTENALLWEQEGLLLLSHAVLSSLVSVKTRTLRYDCEFPRISWGLVAGSLFDELNLRRFSALLTSSCVG